MISEQDLAELRKILLDAMVTIADNAVERASYDKTKRGKIYGVNSADNSYTITINGVNYTSVKALADNSRIYNLGDVVWCKWPLGDPNNMYIIGKVAN